MAEADPDGVLRGVANDDAANGDVRLVATLEEVVADDFVSIRQTTQGVGMLVAIVAHGGHGVEV